MIVEKEAMAKKMKAAVAIIMYPAYRMTGMEKRILARIQQQKAVLLKDEDRRRIHAVKTPGRFLVLTAGSHLVRLVPADYWDGVYQPVLEPLLPNPRRLSSLLTGGPSGRPSARNQTVLSLFFGYHVSFDIFDSRTPGCPPEFMNIPVPKGDPVFDPTDTGKVLLPFQRGLWDKESGQSPSNPRTQVNLVTAWIDGSSIYGPSSSWSDSLRSFSGGLLTSGSEGNMPYQAKEPSLMWSAADPSTGDHGPKGLYELGNAWANENMFTAAEGIIWFRYHNYVASKLHEEHPAWSDEKLFQNQEDRCGQLSGYQKFVDPGISPEFQAAAMRFGITMAPPGVYMRNRTCHFRKTVNMDGSLSPAMRLCNSFWKHLVAMTVQRGRDFGLRSYTEIRKALDLPPVKTFEDINPELNRSNPQLLRDIAELYNRDISKLELFPGGLLEAVGAPGPVFSSIILDQFERIRNGDRFWFENKQNGLFTDEEIQKIRNVNFHDVLIAVTSAEATDIQNNVFFWKNVFLVACMVAYLRKYRYRKFQRRRKAGDRTEEPTVGIAAYEWQGHKKPLHPVSVAVDERRKLQVFDRSGYAQRCLNLGNQDCLDVLLSNDRNHKALLLKVSKEYDLVLEIEKCDAGDMSGVSRKKAREVLECELTASEFADALGLKSDSLFVDSMFTLADKDGNGYLSFQEFLDVMVIFMKGSSEEKSKLMFSMNDIGGTGFLSKEEFARMLRSFIDISNGALSKSQAEDGIKSMMQAAGFNNKEKISWQDFHFLLRDHEKELQFAQLNVKGMEKQGKKRMSRDQRVSFICPGNRLGVSTPNVYVKPKREQYIRNPIQQNIQHFKRFIENYRRHIVCFIVVYGITAGVALERCYYYALQSEATGIPETSMVGIVIARGSAAAISFLFPYMLLTVCRNLITLCRETFLNRYIPFDAAIDFHRFMAMTAIVLSGTTGVLLLFTFAFMYVFASRYFRRISFRAFWITHYLYVVVYILTVIHGSFALIQEPRFYIYLIPPALLFLLDKLISLSRKNVEIPVVRAELLPSGVTHLEFKRPQGFVYRSGQWVRIACLKLGTDEYHPFTLTSAPHEETLSLHIRAVGPWTSQLRDLYTEESLVELAPIQRQVQLYLDGPFGEGHQEWIDFEVSVLGEEELESPHSPPSSKTSCSTFLFVHEAHSLNDLFLSFLSLTCIDSLKVYFIWVTRTQRQFEWVSDIIREVEEMDTQELVSVHTYITQVAEKFDLRTTMLKVWNRSLFTGLRSVTHFGRPPLVSFLSSLQEVHPELRTTRTDQECGESLPADEQEGSGAFYSSL
ncbi:hypothetical protein F7725_023014 [Dissostichus mawsoni]|uniref:NAD(P)H oxidase (H2O2-forming) n=1 Tax=Dissostichus mawsoni TaxID=36200 RepID=A0A7J5Z1N2_DISMA|nr:hypothetical protein F7725_023014 [Dissostichus mawsoni]